MSSFLLKLFHVKFSHYGAIGRPHSGCLHMFVEFALEGKYVLCRQNSNKRIMSLTDNIVLSIRVLSSSNKPLIMHKAGPTGIEVNKAETSHELRHSPGCNITLLACLTKS